MELSVKEIFTDYGSAGFSETWREFLGYFVKQFFPLVKTQIERLYFGRFDYPLLVFPILALGVIALFAFWRKPTYSGAFLLAIPTGVLFYSYFHYWVYWVIVLGLLFTYTVIFERQDKKRQLDNKKVKNTYKSVVKAAKEKPTPTAIIHAFSAIDKAAKKGIIHENKAARLKSSVSKLAKTPKKAPVKK